MLLCHLFTGWWNCLLQRKGQCECAFLPSSVNLFSFSLSPCKHIGHTCIMNVLLLHSIPTPTPPSLPHIPSSPSFYSCKNHHIFTPTFSYRLSSVLQPPVCCFLELFFPCSYLSVIPPSSLSQVKRSLPCFSSNWQMRCMSWLGSCFIRKQLFAPFLPPPLPLSPPHYLGPSLPCFRSSVSHLFLPVSTALIDVNWQMHGRSYKSPQGA